MLLAVAYGTHNFRVDRYGENVTGGVFGQYDVDVYRLRRVIRYSKRIQELEAVRFGCGINN